MGNTAPCTLWQDCRGGGLSAGLSSLAFLPILSIILSETYCDTPPHSGSRPSLWWTRPPPLASSPLCLSWFCSFASAADRSHPLSVMWSLPSRRCLSTVVLYLGCRFITCSSVVFIFRKSKKKKKRKKKSLWIKYNPFSFMVWLGKEVF